jgi:hypothetical protein
MRKLFLALATTLALLGCTAFAQSLQLNVASPEGNRAHIYRTYQGSATLRAQNSARAAATSASNFAGVLTYHNGPVMTKAVAYLIFWLPGTGKLQNGNATSMSAQYQSIQTNMVKDYFGHSLSNNNTQYYQVSGTTKTYISNGGSVGGTTIDTASYPSPSACTDTLTPGNCITDAQIQSEITKVMTAKGWTGGNNHIFLLFTSSGEGSCFDSADCAYTEYCAYHGSFTAGGVNVIYSNQPYGSVSHCQKPNTPTPNGNAAADAAATAASHELTEAITDPIVGTGWYEGANGQEIGDLCAYYYGLVGYKSSTANEFWNTRYYLLQTEYSNYLGNFATTINGTQGPAGCFNNGPEL